jgi:potassium-transporting ATPase ATP-binding subunit
MNENKFSKLIIIDAIKQSLLKLAPSVQVKNPVMLVVYIGALMTTLLYFLAFAGIRDENQGYTLAIALILWSTVLFANFAEAIAEGRGRAQANSLRNARRDVKARKLKAADNLDVFEEVFSNALKVGDIVFVKANEQIPMDGDVIEGAASVDESAITGESAPVIRESGGDRSAVTGGTTLVSDWLVIQVTAEAGESFLDKMIAMVEGASRKKTPNEVALQILLVTLTIIFLVVTATLLPFSSFASHQVGMGAAISITNVIALLVCLAPTTIGALLSSIGIAGMSRLNQANVLAMSGRAIEAAGDVDVLLLDKTGSRPAFFTGG